MLNHKQQAKLAVLHHIGKMMDGMIGDKLKAPKGAKPVAAHMEIDMLPKHGIDAAGSPSGLEEPGMDKHGSPEAPASPDEDEDMKMLRDHYSSLK